jgi:hypothetical protein
VVQEAIWVTGGDEYGICAGEPQWCGIHHYVGRSSDGGRSFVTTSYDTTVGVGNDNAYPYRITAHPWNADVAVVSGYQGLPTVFTHDGGATWGNASIVEGGNSVGPLLSVGPYGNFWWALPLARENNGADVSPTTPATFYFYNGTTSIFVSVDNGATWNRTYSGFPSWNVPLFAIVTPPRGTAAAGDIWAFSGWKLYHSIDGGMSFEAVWQLFSVQATLAVGPVPNGTSRVTGRTAAEMSARCARSGGGAARALPLASAAGPSYVVYAVGELMYQGAITVVVSADYGKTWKTLTTPAQGLGDSPNVVDVSLQSPGTVFVGTEGRGTFYLDASATLLEMLEACEGPAERPT